MKLWPPKQTAACAACGLVITERKRKPCPRCKGITRSIGRTTQDGLTSQDKA